MKHWIEIYQALKKSKNVDLTIKPSICHETTELEPLGDRLWFKYTNQELPVSVKFVRNKTESPVVLHHKPFSSTHFVVTTYYPTELERVAHAILIRRHQVGTLYPEIITYGLAFIPIADFAYLRILDPRDYEPIGPFWATMQINWLFELFDQQLAGDKPKCM